MHLMVKNWTGLESSDCLLNVQGRLRGRVNIEVDY